MGPVVARERILIAMSGGVDSSVAAAWLVQQGYDVVGVTLHLWDYPDDGSVRGRCCAPEDQHDARRVADHLGIAQRVRPARAVCARGRRAVRRCLPGRLDAEPVRGLQSQR